MPLRRSEQTRALDAQILALALPAFLALVAEPLFLLADSAIVGHLGTTELAGLGIAATVVRVAVGMCVFLAYATTAAVARHVGAGQRASALAQGIDGLWLALVLGVVLATGGIALNETLVGLFGASEEVTRQAASYLLVAWFGVPPMLVLLAATGVLRGLHDTRTPLYVAVGISIANVVLNVALVYGAGLGIAGSALGTDLAQLGGAAALVAVVVRTARRDGASLRPDLAGMRRSARAGGPLLVRTLSLQAALVATTYASAGLGAVATATHQLALTIWLFLVYVLDAVAIAAQTITGATLGAGDRERTRELTDRMIRIGFATGVLTAVALALVAPVLGPLFTSDGDVVEMLGWVLLVAAVFQPVAGVVFVLDGVLIGAGDGRYLALWGTVVVLVFVPIALLAVAGAGGAARPLPSLLWLWAAFGVVLMGGRALVLLVRARGTGWMVTGAH